MSDIASSSWDASPERIELAQDEIHVWRAYLDCEESVLCQFESTLSSDERSRAARFSFQRDRNAFVATRGLLRELLGRYLNLSPADLAFEYNSRGKPLLIPLESFYVALTPGQPERLESADSHRWSLRSLKPDPAYVGALVAEGTGWRMRCWDWNPVGCG